MQKLGLALVGCLIAVGTAAAGASSAPSSTAAPGMFKASASGRYIVIAPNKAAFNSALSAAKTGSRVALSMAPVNAFAMNASATVAQSFAKTHRVKVVPDRVESLVRPGMYQDMGMIPPSSASIEALAKRLAVKKHTANPFASPGGSASTIFSGFTPDPAFSLGPPSPMWSIERIGGPAAWATNGGDDEVVVAVEDTGLDYTHDELAPQVVGVADFTTTEVPNICSYYFGLPTDQELAATYGGPADGDWNGHGSWIGGNIAGVVDAAGVNGTAPGVSLVAIKISQNCGSAYDSEMMSGFIWAAEHGIDVVSISFGGYLDRRDPYQDAVYDLYESVVDFATKAGTTIVSSAGNEHVKIGPGGKVQSHGPLTAGPGLSPAADLYGQYEIPAGIKGVVDVSSTGNVVNAPSATCPTTYSTTGAHAYCKPDSDAHQSFGIGKQNQLSYYSNYGTRIDVAGPGGARKFNLPVWDRGGTEGWPFTGTDSVVSSDPATAGESTSDGFQAWEDFSITSNWATEIPCVLFDGAAGDAPVQTGFPDDQCYSTIQGTSMAAPHASATLALIISAHPELRFDPGALIKFLKKSAVTPYKSLSNSTPPLSATDMSSADLTGAPCPNGYCHLGGKAIQSREAYGAGIVNAESAVSGP